MITSLSQTYRKTGQLKTVASKNSYCLWLILILGSLLPVSFSAAGQLTIDQTGPVAGKTAASAVPAYASGPIVSPSQAAGKQNQRVTVRFRVRGTGISYRSVYDELYSEHSWVHPQAFFVRIPKAVKAALRKRDVFDVATHFYGRQIEATGMVQLLEFGDTRRMALVVKRPQDIKLVPNGLRTPTAAYLQRDVLGFNVLLNPALTEQPELMGRLLDELVSQLGVIGSVLPEALLAQLQKASIWVELDKEPDKSAVFHSSPSWIVASGGNKDKIGHIEIVNVRNFIDWSQDGQPALLLHEFTHVFHQRVLGFDNKAIIDAYDRAERGQRYDQVRHVSGQVGSAYASLNPIEYFAEISEAYFVRNDYYPFDRGQLLQHDPIGHDLVRELWLGDVANDPEFTGAKENSGSE